MSGESCQLRRIARLRYGDALPDAIRSAGDVPVFASGGLVGYHDQSNTDGPSIIVGRKGSYGSVHWSDRSAFVIDTAYAVDAAEVSATDLRWLYYVLRSANLGSLTQDVGVPGLRRGLVHELQVPVLDLHLQHEIAEFLDRECGRIDELEAELVRTAQVAVEPALATLALALAEWPTVRVGYRFEVQLGKMLDASRVDAGDTLPYLRNANVYWDRFDLRDLNEMTFSAADRRLYRVRPGDLLVCEGRHVGRSAVWSGEVHEMYFQKALHRVRARVGDSTRFLMWCLRLMHDRGDFYADGTGSTIPHLPAERLRAARIPLPPPTEQRRILQCTDAHARVGRQLEDHALAMGSLLSEYRDALITEAVRGQLDITRLSQAQMDETLDAVRQSERPEVLAS